MQIIELLTPAYDVAWLPWAVQYFFLIGMASTAALTAAGIVLIGGPERPAWRLLPVWIVVLLVTAIAAPVSLLADLHQPARFWHFYAFPSRWSWMAAGAFLLPIFVATSIAFCAAWWAGKVRWLKRLGIVVVLSALSVLVYTGMEVMVVRSRPLWSTPFLPINFALSGWMAALGAVWLISRWMPGGQAALPLSPLLLLSRLSAMLLMVCAVVWAVVGLAGLEPSFDAALELFRRFPVWRLGLSGSVLVGLLIVGLLSLPVRVLSRPGLNMALALVMLAAAWMFRWIIFMAVQGVPKYGAGLYLYRMPLGADGLAGMTGMLGLCVALLCAVTLLLQHFPARSASA